MTGTGEGYVERARRVCVVKSRRFPLRAQAADDGGTVNAWAVTAALRRRRTLVDVFTRSPEPALAGTTMRAQWGVRVHYVAYEPAEGVADLERDLREGVSFGTHLAATPAFRRLADDPGTVVHAHHWTSTVELAAARLVYTPHLLAFRKAQLLGRPLPDPIHRAEAAILRRADRVIALSRSERDDIVTAYGIEPDRIAVIPNGVDQRMVSAAIGTGPEGFRILSVGRLARQKGIDDAIRAVAWLRERGVAATLDVVGSSYAEPQYEDHLRAVVRVHRLEKHVRFNGAVDRAAMGKLFGRYDFLLHLSRYESQGIAVLEAMSAGLIVIAADLPAIGEYVESGRNGVLVPPGDFTAAGQAMLDLAASPARSSDIRMAAEAVGRRFTWSACTRATLELLR